MMELAILGACLCWVALAALDAVKFEINPGWLIAAVIGSVLAMYQHPGFALQNHVLGGAVGLAGGALIYTFHRRGVGMGDIGLFGAMFCVGGADRMVFTVILFAGFAFSTTLIYACIRKKPFWKTGFPAAIPASCASILMLFVNTGW